MLEGSDSGLVDATLKGDSRAFEALVVKHEKTLFNAAYRITGNRDDAMDATQSAFVKAYEKLHTFDPSYRFFSWIFRIVVNESFNILNRRRRHTDDDPAGESHSGSDDPEQSYGAAEQGRHLHSGLQQLKPDLRAVLVLRHFHGLSYREMSDVIGIPEKTVKSRLFTARRNLRSILLVGGVVR